MSEPYELPHALLQAVLSSPERRLSFRQAGYQITIQLTPDTAKATPRREVAPFTPTPVPRMKLELLEDTAPPLSKPTPAPATAPATGAPPTKAPESPLPPKPPASLRETSARDALRTMGGGNMISPVDFLSMLSDEERGRAESLISALDQESPKTLFPDLPNAQKEQNASPTSEKSDEGDPLEDTQPDPEEGEEAEFAFSKKFENAFLDDDDDGWQVVRGSAFRMLRNTDTPIVLGYLFRRLARPVEALEQLLPLGNSPLSSAHLARAAGVKAVLPHPIPFAHSADAPPRYHLVGLSQSGVYLILYQNDSDQTLHFAPIPKDGGTLQIALVEGEELLTDEELTELFKQGARVATPEQAEATAKQLQKKLSQKADAMGQHGQRPLALSPVSVQQHRGLERAIPVNERLIKRLEYNRTLDQEHLWDEGLQPGVAVFRYNLATLFQDERPIVEGVLLCITERRQYLVFDRRSKRSIPLNPKSNQQIWLRHDEKLV